MKWSARGMLVLVFVIASVAVGIAGIVPQTLNYQGTLTDNAGQLINGTKDITAKLYDVANGGTPFWTEQQTGVVVKNGQFSLVLGANAANLLDSTKLAGATYIGITIGTDTEMVPRQQFTSVAYALRSDDGVPKRAIIMWSGTIEEIPAGWALCDGRTVNGVTTPDLQDRFVVGIGARFGAGKLRGVTGGEEEHVLTIEEMPSHTHIQDPHRHSYTAENGDGQNKMRAGASGSGTYGPYNFSILDTTATNRYTGGGAAHNNLPPYYALAFIMRIK